MTTSNYFVAARHILNKAIEDESVLDVKIGGANMTVRDVFGDLFDAAKLNKKGRLTLEDIYDIYEESRSIDPKEFMSFKDLMG